MRLLEGKVAIITGGGSGIGKGIAEVFARENASLVITGIDFLDTSDNHCESKQIDGYKNAVSFVQELTEMGIKAIALESNVTLWNDVQKMVDETMNTFGKIDILVNNAGIATRNRLEDLSEQEWDNLMEVNSKGVFLCCKAVVPIMKKNRTGKIINIASVSGKRGYPGQSHYCASKFAVVGFTNAIAMELAPDNINVNAICPGIVATRMWEYSRKKKALPGEDGEAAFQRTVKEGIPLGVPQTPAAIGETALFLALSEHITGQAINVDGGMVFP
ncbi:MAG: glucose 1-dehydrogenase [Candidatus Atribacteria bacterium]|nr:glucose 1-dehydrogenase [Candidatus Atribacteria bacterium]